MSTETESSEVKANRIVTMAKMVVRFKYGIDPEQQDDVWDELVQRVVGIIDDNPLQATGVTHQ